MRLISGPQDELEWECYKCGSKYALTKEDLIPDHYDVHGEACRGVKWDCPGCGHGVGEGLYSFKEHWIEYLEKEKGMKTEEELDAENLKLKVFPEKEPEAPVRQGFWKSLRKWIANED
jgi:hypothetical protein